MSCPGAQPEVDMSSAEFVRDPHGMQAKRREKAPVYQAMAPSGAKVWVVCRHAEARDAFTDTRLSKDAAGLQEVLSEKLGEAANGVPAEQLATRHLLHSDPPDHARLRKLIARAFSANQIERIRPRVAEHTDALLGALGGRDEFDLLSEFAFPLPVRVICELIGVPDEEQRDFLFWCGVYAGGGDPKETGRAAGQIKTYLAGRLEIARAEPKDDLLSSLVRAHDDGDRLSDEELLGTLFLLLVAGHETTANLIANGTLALLNRPGHWEVLRTDPAMLPGAIEELLRFDGPGTMASLRFTTTPVDIGGTVIPAGEIVLIGLAAANRDPARFTDPDVLDLTRQTQGHVAFGHGIHFCVGAALARLEAGSAFRGLLTHFPRLRLGIPPDELQWHQSMLFRRLRALPVKPA